MNKIKLDAIMREKRVTKKALCSALGISRTALYRKTNGISEFTVSEMEKIISILEIAQPAEIFFNSGVS